MTTNNTTKSTENNINSAKSTIKTPWNKFYGEVPSSLEYTALSMSGKVEEVSKKYPNLIAFSFMGKNTTYKKMWDEIELNAKALKAIGVNKNDRVTICLPNCPQAVTMFYAVNLIGAVANMIHPLSSVKEIEFYIKDSKSVCAITLDQFYGKFEEIRSNINLKTLLITSIKDALGGVMKVGFALTLGRKIKKIPTDADVLMWKDFIKAGRELNGAYRIDKKADEEAVILYSGGTTGVTKGILLSNLNFNALGAQIVAMAHCFNPGDVMLAVMPIFHGFGLGVSIHTMLVNGGQCILVPQFTPLTYAKLIKKHKPNYIAGVPTLFEALLRIDELDNVDLSCLLGVFSGGDSLTAELKKRIDKFLAEHNCKVNAREGYGTTECVTASCLTPYTLEKEGSIGIPLPDMFYKIVKPETEIELPYGEAGEICIAGVTVMIEYANQPQETAKTKRKHADGLEWIHTGDLGFMDEDGFIYFKQRIKRIIVSSGYNIYPSNIENVLEACELVHLSCAIGIKDPYKMQKVKAFVVLKDGVAPNEETRTKIMEHCKKYIAKYALPSEIEFRDSLPKTLVGKVAYRVLEEECTETK